MVCRDFSDFSHMLFPSGILRLTLALFTQFGKDLE